MLLVAAIFGLAAGLGLFAWFRWLIISGRSTTLALFVLSLLLLETILYQQIDVPLGIFHLQAGGMQVRLIDLVLLVAFLARLSVPRRRPLNLAAGAWLAFAAWLTFEAFLGVRDGNSATYVSYEYKTLLYLGAAYAVGTARVDRLRDIAILMRMCKVAAAIAAVLLLTSIAHVDHAINISGLRGASLGQISSILSTLMPILGIVALAQFLCTRPLRYGLLASALLLFATVIAPAQRASPLDLAVSLAVLVVLAPFGRRHLKITPTELGLGVAALLFVAGAAWVGRAAITQKGSVPFSANVTIVLHGGEKSLSAQDRVNQLVVAKHLIAQRPVFGWGLGKTITYYEVGFKELVTSYLTHNILTDLWIRTGLVGLLLFLTAFWLTVNDLLKAWRSELLSPHEGALALAAVAILAGWFAHGMVESLFEHVEITPFVFILVGFGQATVRRRAAAAAAAASRADGGPQLEALPRPPGAPPYPAR